MGRTCRMCGNIIDSDKHNVFYCKDCVKVRKVQLDREAWLRRKARKLAERQGTVNPRLLRVQEKIHAELMGLTYREYDLWKVEFPEEYQGWLKSRIRNQWLV